MRKILLLLLAFMPFTFVGIKPASLVNYTKFTICEAQIDPQVEDFMMAWSVMRFDEVNQKVIQTCDITREDFKPVYDKYFSLTNENRLTVDETDDPYESAYKIKAVLNTLIDRLYPSVNPTDKKENLSQTNTIIIIVCVAVFGVSTISIFFVLKNNKIID